MIKDLKTFERVEIPGHVTRVSTLDFVGAFPASFYRASVGHSVPFYAAPCRLDLSIYKHVEGHTPRSTTIQWRVRLTPCFGS